MPMIDVTNLTFAYEGSYDNIFEDVSFRIDTDWKLGLVGRNGKGKTTLMRLFAGAYPYKGSITKSAECAYFPYTVHDMSALTRDIVDALEPDCEEWMLLREMALLRVPEEVLYRPFDTLSGGERTKTLLALLFCREDRFLLIDEPTNHLDGPARELVCRYLRSKKGFILVSHDRLLLDECVDHILAINRAGIELQKGNFSSWRENKRRQDAFELDQNEKLKKDIKRLESAARQSSQWADKVERTKIGFNPAKHEKSMDNRAYIGEQSRRMQQRRKNLEKRQTEGIEEKSRLLKNVETVEDLKLFPLAYHSERLLSFRDTALYYGEKQVCGSLSFTVNRGDRVALRGPNGCGKTSLLKLILGEYIAYTGEFHRASGLVISYVSQDTSLLSGDLRDFEEERGMDAALFRAILRKLDFSREQFEKDLRDYSEGQKKKILIAASLCERAHLYIWDEPLNYIDVFSRMQIEELLLRFAPTILFVEHDRAFCENIATDTVELT